MDQHSRMAVLHDFKNGKHHVLVATDVAARGLDIKSIKSVVNYDAAKEIDTHVHRIGRTGRAGDKEGTAYTLVTPYETRFAGKCMISCMPLFVKLWTTAYKLRSEQRYKHRVIVTVTVFGPTHCWPGTLLAAKL